MSIFKKKETPLDLEIGRIEGLLTKTTPGTKEYETLRTTLTELEAIREKRKADPKIKAAVITGVSSILGIVTIAVIENSGTIFRSKGFSLLPKGRG